MQGDESLYSAYLRSLVDGRPRKNDPFSTTLDEQVSETAFSIQFVPAYVLTAFAKLFHLAASSALILLGPLAALAAGLAIFG